MLTSCLTGFHSTKQEKLFFDQQAKSKQMDQRAFWVLQKQSYRWRCIKVNKCDLLGSLLSKAPTQSSFWSNISSILHQILKIRVSICSWDIGLQSCNILITVWASRTSPRSSEDPVTDVSRDILNSKLFFKQNKGIWDIVHLFYRWRVVYQVFVDLLHCKMAIWFCWSF